MRKQSTKKTESIHILCSPAELATLAAAAKAAHLPLGTWLRALALKAAAMGAALLMLGCGRALPYEDQADIAVAAAPAPDQGWQRDAGELMDAADDALCDPTAIACCIEAILADCVAPVGTNGCSSDKCRGYYVLVQDMGCNTASLCGCVPALGATCFAVPGTGGCAEGFCRGR